MSNRKEEGGAGEVKVRHFADEGADVRMSELTNVRFQLRVNGSLLILEGHETAASLYFLDFAR